MSSLSEQHGNGAIPISEPICDVAAPVIIFVCNTLGPKSYAEKTLAHSVNGTIIFNDLASSKEGDLPK